MERVRGRWWQRRRRRWPRHDGRKQPSSPQTGRETSRRLVSRRRGESEFSGVLYNTEV